ncbi:MAG: hypothetical protein CL787_02275 [Chloroflexi bacterium]|nr:hypothetical protein [Chloroflexota bacterium]|tara:strand:+ start:2531 stop:2917 length:387 start_codon:yes stop_codon:yes gene_type:complete
MGNIFSNIKKIILISLGLVFLALGIAGYILPGLPGTIFLIISAGFFVRSSERLYNFVVQNRFFGKGVKDFLETGEMPLRAKIISISCIWIFSIASLFAPYDLIFKIPIIILAITGTLYIRSKPTRKIV